MRTLLKIRMTRRASPPAVLEFKDRATTPEYRLQMAMRGDFSRLSEQDRAALLPIPAEKRAEFLSQGYQDTLEACERELSRLLAHVEPATFIALCAAAGHLRTGEADALPIGHSHVELAQFLALKYGQPTCTSEPSIGTYSRILQLIRDYSDYTVLSRSPALIEEGSNTETLRNRLSFVTAMHFSGNRSWAYPQQIEALLLELVAPLDQRLTPKLGYPASPIIRLWRRLRDRTFARLTAFHSARQAVQDDPLTEECLETLLGQLDELEIASLTSTIRQADSNERRQASITSHASCLFKFTMEDFLALVPELGPDALRRYLTDRSFELGQLSTCDLSEAVTWNPIWLKPLIRLDADSFLIPLPSLFHAFAFLHLETLFENAGLLSAYSERRSAFLEAKVAALFGQAFPSASQFPGSEFSQGGKDGENDLLVKVGNWLIVVEAKSHKVNPPERRGAIKSLQDKIQQLLAEPSDQSYRFTAYLASHPGRHSLRRRKGPPNEVDTTDSVRILRLSVTLESLGPAATNAPVLQEIGIAEKDDTCATTMHLLELATVFEILPTEEQRLDYLFRRSELQGQCGLIGQERDLLMLYVASALRVSWRRSELGDRLDISHWHKKLDDYFMNPLEGKAPIQYQRRFTPLWLSLFTWIRESAPHYWPEAAMILLTFSYPEQKQAGRELKRESSRSSTVVGRSVTASTWGEKFLVAFKVVEPAKQTAVLTKLRAHMVDQLSKGEGDHALLILLRARDLSPLEMVVLTNRTLPSWL